MTKKRRNNMRGFSASASLPAGVSGSIDIGSDVIDTVRKEVEWVVGEVQKLIGQTGRGVSKQLKKRQREMRRLSKKHRKSNPTLAVLLDQWVSEIDKRLKMGVKEYKRLERKARRIEEKMF